MPGHATDGPAAERRTYRHLLHAAERLFRPVELQRLLRSNSERPAGAIGSDLDLDSDNAIGAATALAFEFLGRGGKHFRPFITLAAYDAVTGAKGTLPNGADQLASLPAAVRRTALSIETFHKASLIHDDVEDDDAYRYGSPTLHRKYGVPTAINVGDYLIGLGYRLVSREATVLGTAPATDIIDHLAAAHMKLCQGQGAELAWRHAGSKRLTPADALHIYVLKTAPAFEVALYAGLRLAGSVQPWCCAIEQLSRNLGIAFQILNDLNDWQGDGDNKITAGTDILGRRPTVLWAMAADSFGPAAQRQLETLLTTKQSRPVVIDRLRELYRAEGVFAKAECLVSKHRQCAAQVAAGIDLGPLRNLFFHLIDTLLEPPADQKSRVRSSTQPSGLPVVA